MYFSSRWVRFSKKRSLVFRGRPRCYWSICEEIAIFSSCQFEVQRCKRIELFSREKSRKCPTRPIIFVAYSLFFFLQDILSLWMNSPLLEVQLKPHHKPFFIRYRVRISFLLLWTHGRYKNNSQVQLSETRSSLCTSNLDSFLIHSSYWSIKWYGGRGRFDTSEHKLAEHRFWGWGFSGGLCSSRILQMVDSNQNDTNSFTLYLSILLYCVL